MTSQFCQRRDRAAPQALSAEQADLDLGLIQPTAVFWGVVNRKPISEQTADFFSVTIDQCFTPVRVQIVHHQVDRVSLRGGGNDLYQVVGELRGGAAGRNPGEVAAGLGLDTAKGVGCAAALIAYLDAASRTVPHPISLFLAAPGDGAYRRHSRARTGRCLDRALALVQLTQNPCASQHTR